MFPTQAPNISGWFQGTLSFLCGMIWGWLWNYYWLCYKCLGREIRDTPRTQLTPPNVAAPALPREITASSENAP